MNFQQSNAPEEPLLTSRIIHKNSNEWCEWMADVTV